MLHLEFVTKGRCQKHPQGGSLILGGGGIDQIHYFRGDQTIFRSASSSITRVGHNQKRRRKNGKVSSSNNY